MGYAVAGEIIEGSHLLLGRLISQIAHGVGVPISLLRLGEYPDLFDDVPDPLLFTRDRLPDDVQALLTSSQGALRDRYFEIVASGRRYEHPFVSLLRDNPIWALWEMSVLKWMLNDLDRQARPARMAMPSLFSDSMQVHVEWSDPLKGLLIYGPLPSQRAFEGDLVEKEINAFISVARSAKVGQPAFEPGGSAPCLRPSSNFPSLDRLRRMFYAGGRVFDEQVSAAVRKASKAIRAACAAETADLPINEQFHDRSLRIVEDLASAALLRERSNKPDLDFYFPDLNSAGYSIVSPRKGTLRLVSLSKSQAEAIRALQENPETPTVTSDGEPEDDPTERLRDFLAQVDERSTQSMMQQFMLRRHWLNDRFARLNSLYHDKPDEESGGNLLLICDWLLRLFDADFTAIYNVAPGGVLRELMGAARSEPAAQHHSAVNSEKMRALLEDERAGERRFSVCYRALHSQRAVPVPRWNGDLSEDGMYADASAVAGAPRAALAAPIMVFGLPWGVIELVGFCPNQFDRFSRMWLEEASQLIGNAMYQTWILKQITQANLVVLSEAGVGNEDGDGREDDPTARHQRHIALIQQNKETRALAVRNSICKEMAELFVADGAALWIANEQWPGRYQLRGCYGIDIAELGETKGARPPWPEISIDDQDSLVAKVMRANAAPVLELVGEEICEPTEEQTPRGRYRRALWKSGMRYLTIVPLIETSADDDYTPLGALVLYSARAPTSAEGSYGPRWIPLIEFAGRHLAMLIRTLALEAERQNSLELMFSHEVIGSLRRVEDQFGYVYGNLLEPYLRSGRGERIPPATAPLRDLERAISRVRSGIGDAVWRLDEMRRDGFKMPGQVVNFKSGMPWDKEPVVLYSVIQSAFNARYRDRQRRNTSWQMTGSKDYIRLCIHPQDLETIFNNLADNAIKYSNPHATIYVNVKREPTNDLRVEFINEAPPLRPGEANRLFRQGFRGGTALANHVDGSGNGLYISKELASAVGADLFYQEHRLQGKEDVSHRFVMIFGEESVIYGAK